MLYLKLCLCFQSCEQPGWSRGTVWDAPGKCICWSRLRQCWSPLVVSCTHIKGELQTICRFSYMKVYKLITLGTKFKNLLSLGGKMTMFSKFITNYIEQGWWHSSLSLKCMHLQLKEVNKRGGHAQSLHGWTCLASGIVMEIHCHITGICEAPMSSSLFSVIGLDFPKYCYSCSLPK